MTDLLVSRLDLDFWLFDWLGIDRDTRVDREMAAVLLDTAERLAETAFLPHYRDTDIHEPYLDETGRVCILPGAVAALRRYAELGLFGLSFDERIGGHGLPMTVSASSYSLFAAANLPVISYVMLGNGNARLIATFGSEAQIEAFARPQVEGRWLGTMCLSEPQAGSNLGEVRTRAVHAADDAYGARYSLSGNKMWITGGDQDVTENIVHLVLAKVPLADGTLPEGTRGLSLFIVPRILPDGTLNDVQVAGLNHKMGYRGSANCLLNFGEASGATGWIVGEAGEGLRQMFTMMNEARIYVGLGAAALAYRGYRHSVRYAAERLQGRSSDGTPGQIAIIDHADVRRMLLQQKAYAEGALALCLYAASLVDREGEPGNAALLELLTPVVKSWPSEFGLIANDLAIQVHGCYGYTRDFDVEQLWRDNRLNPIHEGTTGIQAIDLLGRKILRSHGQGLGALAERVRTTAANATDDLREFGDALVDAWSEVDRSIESARAAGTRALNEATLFLRGFGHVVVAWLWLDQAIAARRSDNPEQVRSKAQCCRYFYGVELPSAVLWLRTMRLNPINYCDIDLAIFDVEGGKS